MEPQTGFEKRDKLVFNFLARYFELRCFIDIKDPELLPYVLTPQKENPIENYLEDLKIFESVSKKLQNENSTMENASILFSGLCWNFKQIIQVSIIICSLTKILCFRLTLTLEL